MIELETMITSLRLTWLKRIFGVNDGAWKDYFCHQLKRVQCKSSSYFIAVYTEVLQWWAHFRDDFSTEKYWYSIIRNHQDIRINKAVVFYKTFFQPTIICVNDLIFHLNNLDSYKTIS